MVNREENKERFLQMLKKTGGIIVKACESADVSRSQYYRWMEQDESFKERVDEINEGMIDFVESKLMQQINAGDTTATIFFLKTKGKHRGYHEKIQLDGNMSNDVRISFVAANSDFAKSETDIDVGDE
jgi:transposase-like protein